MPDKVDLKEELDAYRAPRGRFRVVDVPDLERQRTILRQPVTSTT